ncbi:MAG TPA: hypothetical protein VHO03_08075 [Ignavibacteriales bacterium]|nr:hypothetical protein [Ignavibacteriales bacterium]
MREVKVAKRKHHKTKTERKENMFVHHLKKLGLFNNGHLIVTQYGTFKSSDKIPSNLYNYVSYFEEIHDQLEFIYNDPNAEVNIITLYKNLKAYFKVSDNKYVPATFGYRYDYKSNTHLVFVITNQNMLSSEIKTVREIFKDAFDHYYTKEKLDAKYKIVGMIEFSERLTIEVLK